MFVFIKIVHYSSFLLTEGQTYTYKYTFWKYSSLFDETSFIERTMDATDDPVNFTDHPLNFTGTESSLVGREEIIENKTVQALFCMVYTATFIVGISGNVLVCYVVCRNRAMQTVTNFFIMNLALADILLCALAVPFTPLYTFLGQWIFGSALCHLVAYAQGSSVYISSLTLTSIAIDRFFVIIYPFQPRMKLITCIVVICSIWIFSLLVTLPYGIYMHYKYYEDRYYCSEDWPTDELRKVYGGLTASMQFVLPFIIIAFCYTRVSLKLNDRARAKPGAKNSRKEEIDRERKRRTNRMLIAMVTIFAVSWMPLNAINVINDMYHQISYWRYYYLCFFMAHALAMSSTCYNPFLYAWLNENFRKEFKQVLPCFEASITRTVSARSERTCNGNDTMQETLLPMSKVPLCPKDDGVEVETLVGPAVTYSSGGELVRLGTPAAPCDDAI